MSARASASASRRLRRVDELDALAQRCGRAWPAAPSGRGDHTVACQASSAGSARSARRNSAQRGALLVGDHHELERLAVRARRSGAASAPGRITR